MKHLLVTIAFIAAISGGASSVQADAYPMPRWQSYADYLERKLTVQGFHNPTCSNGVEWIGGDYFRIPVGVSEFKCVEREGE